METSSLFTAEMITEITNALTSVANNVLAIFIDLLPVMAIIAGVGFGIRFVLRLFSKTSRGK